MTNMPPGQSKNPRGSSNMRRINIVLNSNHNYPEPERNQALAVDVLDTMRGWTKADEETGEERFWTDKEIVTYIMQMFIAAQDGNAKQPIVINQSGLSAGIVQMLDQLGQLIDDLSNISFANAGPDRERLEAMRQEVKNNHKLATEHLVYGSKEFDGDEGDEW